MDETRGSSWSRTPVPTQSARGPTGLPRGTHRAVARATGRVGLRKGAQRSTEVRPPGRPEARLQDWPFLPPPAARPQQAHGPASGRTRGPRSSAVSLSCGTSSLCCSRPSAPSLWGRGTVSMQPGEGDPGALGCGVRGLRPGQLSGARGLRSAFQAHPRSDWALGLGVPSGPPPSPLPPATHTHTGACQVPPGALPAPTHLLGSCLSRRVLRKEAPSF